MTTNTPTFLEEVYVPTDEPPQADIVFVHGLNPFNTPDFAKQTWTYKNGDRKTFWPRDLLPNNVPNCRILIFGYNSNVAWDVSLQGIKDHANTLLDRFTGIRNEESKTRPVIFVAHSLGGLVVKQALINASNNSHAYGSIKSATYGLVFFGTPHRGGNGTSLGIVAANIVTAVSGGVRNSLLKSLSKDSVLTQNAHEDFSHQWEDYRVVSFFETRKTEVKRRFFHRVLNSIVVDAISAKLGLGGRRETQLPIDADHSGMCKFEAVNDKYEPVGRNIKCLAEYSIGETKNRSQVLKDRFMGDVPLYTPQIPQVSKDQLMGDVPLHTPQIRLSEKEQKCLQGFYLSDYKTHRQEISRRHHPGTCEWVLKHPEYLLWAKGGKPLLWISGGPGMGKSVIASFLLKHLEDSIKTTPGSAKRIIYYFFNDQDENKKTAVSFLRAIIHQLLTASTSLLTKHVISDYESLGGHLYDSFATLWKIFITIASDSELDGVYCVIDALDECEDISRVHFLQQLTELSNPSSGPNGKPQRSFPKFILTSRPYNYIRMELSEPSVIHLEAEREDESINTDIGRFIASEVEKLASNRKYNNPLKGKIKQKLNEGADGMFLWVVLIIEILKKTPISDTEQVMKKLPKKIDGIYIEILKDIPTFARKILMWVVYAYRPLKLNELAVAYTIQKKHKVLSSISTDVLDGIRGDIQLCGPMLKVQKDDTVHLVHQSAKDFLLRSGPPNPSISEFLIRNTQPHYEIAVACATYLSFQGWTNLPQESSWQKTLVPWRDPREARAIEGFLESHPFLGYAALYWHQHVVQAEEKHLELWECVHGFLSAESNRKLTMRTYQFVNPEYYLIPFSSGLGPLHILSRFGLHFFLQHIFSQEGADLDSTDDQGRTPLSWAASEGHGEVVKLLIGTQSVDVNSKDRYGQTPLSFAASRGHVEVVKLLVGTQSMDVNSKNQYGQTPLSFAASRGHVEVAKLLVGTQSVDVNSKDADGWTPLSWAASNRHVEVVKLLVGTQSVDVNSKDADGRTPLSMAASKGHVEVDKLLVGTQSVDVNSKDEYGQTPLSRAASGGHVEVVKLLVGTQSVDVNSKDADGQTPLSFAASRGHVEVAKLLVGTQSVDVNSKDADGWTPLSWAASNRHVEVVKLLVSTQSVDVNSKDADGWTPLFLAASGGHVEVVKLLVGTQSVDVNSKDAYGQTPLSRAASNGHVEVVKLLVSTEGVDVNSKDKNGMTAFSLTQNPDIIEALHSSCRPKHPSDSPR